MKKFFFCFLILVVGMIQTGWGETIRKSVWSGRFYPNDPSELKKMIEKLSLAAKNSPDIHLPDGPLKALILPHAGYIYSGLTAAHAVKVLHANQFSKVIIMGPDHRVGMSCVSLSDVDAYETPFGKILVHPDARKLRKISDIFKSVELSDQSEHSVEVILPFMHYFLKSFQFIPLVVGEVDPITLAHHIQPLLDNSTLLVSSSDLSHYLKYAAAKITDGHTIELILNRKLKALAQKDNAACGTRPIQTILYLAKKLNWIPVLLHKSNSGDTAGDKTRVVGYATIAFFEGKKMMTDNKDQLNEKQGNALLKLARSTIAKKLGKPYDEAPDTELKEDSLQVKKGTFVTLNINGQLRGCIGSLVGQVPLAKGVADNAINAAFHDPRFSPLTANEYENIHIEVSVLTEPQPLDYTDTKDLLEKLTPEIHGVILRKGYASATFLPQVWEQLPTHDAFLSHLCLKAGLPGDTWKRDHLEIQTYQVQYFEE
ncbi:MAG: AmmeMemoRadiSam system protein B [Candidatus Magnetomorum sp.]|nr:AmmeMemoRadiSam system protein B [Candidatus Magnetomorum sp.]